MVHALSGLWDRGWHRTLSVVIAVVVGVVTNLITDGYSWPLLAGIVGLVIAQVLLSAWQGREDRRELRSAQDSLLGELRPRLPGAAAGATPRNGVLLLEARYCPTPFWGRRDSRDALTTWCVGEGDDVLRVLAGPAGVGKTRLALAVADELPASWACGFLRRVDGLVDRIVAAGDPTLVIVEDAERVAGVDELVSDAARHPHLVRLLLLTRHPGLLDRAADPVFRARVAGSTLPLEQLGTDGDRRRWFAEAARGYAESMNTIPPDVRGLPVGRDADSLLVLHARAFLEALGRSGVRSWGLPELAHELVELERRSWTGSLPHIPAAADLDTVAEVVTVLLLNHAEDHGAAAEHLRAVSGLASITAGEARFALARWARTHYPVGGDHRIALRPHLVAERLILDTLDRRPALVDHDAPLSGHTTVTLARAYQAFPTRNSLELLVRHAMPEQTRASRIARMAGSGARTPELDRRFADLVRATSAWPGVELSSSVLPHGWPHLSAALGMVEVALARRAHEIEPRDGLAPLAAALIRLATMLGDLGRFSEAAEVGAEAVGHWRALAEANPEQYDEAIADALSIHGYTLRALGQLQQALPVGQEAVMLSRAILRTRPGQYRAGALRALSNLGRV